MRKQPRFGVLGIFALMSIMILTSSYRLNVWTHFCESSVGLLRVQTIQIVFLLIFSLAFLCIFRLGRLLRLWCFSGFSVHRVSSSFACVRISRSISSNKIVVTYLLC